MKTDQNAGCYALWAFYDNTRIIFEQIRHNFGKNRLIIY